MLKELDEFEDYIKQNSLTLPEFLDFKRENGDVRFIALGITQLDRKKLKSLCIKEGLIYYETAITAYLTLCPHLVFFGNDRYPVFFALMSKHYLNEGYHFAMFLPPNGIFTFEGSSKTRYELEHLIGSDSKIFEHFYSQITLVTGYYS